jgi:PAS domain S-box-containing protein
LRASNQELEREIAERERAQTELRDSEAQYRELFDRARDSISLVSIDGKFIAINPGFEAMGGFSAQEWIGRPFTEILHPDDVPRILGYFQKLLRGETIPTIELRFITKSGEYRIGEVSSSARYRHGQIAGAMAIVRDVTDRKRAQENLELQLQRISALREINAAATSTLDLHAVFIVLFETVQRLLPYSALQVWLRHDSDGRLERTACWNLDERDWKDRMLAGVPELMRLAMEKKTPVRVADIRGDPRTHDREFFRRHGLVSYLGAPLLAKDESLGVLVFLTREAHEFDDDETSFLAAVAGHAAAAIQNAQLYEKVQRQAAELEQANRAQADFTAMIAHDLRSPLSNIVGIAEMMHQGLFGEANDDQKEWLNRMANNAKNLVTLVSDFLDLSKLGSGRIELARANTRVLDFLQNTVANYLPVAASKGIALTCRGEDSLPSISVDSRRLDQVLTNLLSNALKFTPEGGAIEIAAVRDGNRIRISVVDTGIGIPGDEVSGLFQKYRQVNRFLASEQAGTGLGLVICKMIVEAHGGQIWVESEEGRGTSVHFTLPLDANPEQRADGEIGSFQDAGSGA